MKKRFPILLAPFILLTMVSCGPDATSNPATSVPTPPTSSVTPPTSVPVPPSSTIIPPSTSPVVPPTSVPVPPTSVPVPPTSVPVPPTSVPVPPTSVPVPPTSVPVPPTSSIPVPPGPSSSTEPVVPLSPQEMHAVVRDAVQSNPVEFIAKVVAIEQYSTNPKQTMNLFMQNEVYGFRVNNVPLGSAVVGKTYKVKGGALGTDKKYVGINYNTLGVPGSIEEAPEVTANQIPWSSTLNVVDTVSATVKATGRIQSKDEYKLTVKVGSDLLVLSANSSTTIGAAVKEKFAAAKVGHEIDFVGFPSDKTDLKLISILDPTLITYGEAIKEPLPGTISRDVNIGGDKLNAVVEGDKITFSGEVAYDEASQSNLVGFEITKNSALASIDDLKVCPAECEVPENWLTKTELAEIGIIVDADSFKLTLPTDQLKDDKTIQVTVRWSDIISDQVFTIAGNNLIDISKPTKTYVGSIKGDPNSDLGGAATGSVSAEKPIAVSKSDDGSVITFGAAGYEIAFYQADETLGRTAGNRVGVQIDKPSDLDDTSATTVRINDNAALNWNDISDDPVGKSYFWFYPLIKDVTVENKVTITWSADSAPQVFTIKIAEGTLLQKDPNLPAISSSHYNIDEDFVYSSNVSSALSSIPVTELEKGVTGDHIISSVNNLVKVYSTSTTFKNGQVLKFASGTAAGSINFGLTKEVTQVKIKWMTWSGKKTSLTVNGVNMKDDSTGGTTGTIHEFTFDITASNSIDFSTLSGFTGFLLAIEFIG